MKKLEFPWNLTELLRVHWGPDPQ